MSLRLFSNATTLCGLIEGTFSELEDLQVAAFYELIQVGIHGVEVHAGSVDYGRLVGRFATYLQDFGPDFDRFATACARRTRCQR